MKYEFTAEVWQYSGPGGWFFVSVEHKISHEIRENLQWQEEGWGRLKATAKIGNSTWKTSIWFDTKKNTYFLPLKAEIRKKKKIRQSLKYTPCFSEDFLLLQFHPNQKIISRHKKYGIIGIKGAVGSGFAGKNGSEVFAFGSENQHTAGAGGKYPSVLVNHNTQTVDIHAKKVVLPINCDSKDYF